MLSILRFIYFSILLIIVVSCNGSNADKQIPDTANKDSSHSAVSPSFKCFTGIDTMNGGFTGGCMGTFYKVIDKKYVLAISYDIRVQYDSCARIVVDTGNKRSLLKLAIFRDGEATLDPYCNDVAKSGPFKELTNASGVFFIKFYHPVKYTGGDKPTVSIWVERLSFYDSTDKKPVVFTNELLWKVDDWRIPAG